jgi:hypothetical protein
MQDLFIIIYIELSISHLGPFNPLQTGKARQLFREQFRRLSPAKVKTTKEFFDTYAEPPDDLNDPTNEAESKVSKQCLRSFRAHRARQNC